MASDLTPAELATLRRLLEAATPGPWRVYGSGSRWKLLRDDTYRYVGEVGTQDAALIAALVNAASALIEMAERELHGRMAMKHEH